MPTTSPPNLLHRLAERAKSAGVFGPVGVREGILICHAKASAAPASFRVFAIGEVLWVSLVMADRWLSESIETDLLHSGDSITALLDEELMDLGGRAGTACEHFRSDDLLFTFRSPLAIPRERWDTPEGEEAALRLLLAYESCFRRLGDMEAGTEA